MLITERDLQVEHLLSVALEAKMPRLNDPGMDGTNGNFVNLFPFNAVEICHTNERFFSGFPAPGIVSGTIRLVKPDRLEPRVSFRAHSILLGNLSFKEMNLWAIGRHRGKPIGIERYLPDAQNTSRA